MFVTECIVIGMHSEHFSDTTQTRSCLVATSRASTYYLEGKDHVICCSCLRMQVLEVLHVL